MRTQGIIILGAVVAVAVVGSRDRQTANHTRGVSSVCPVHNVKMVKACVPIEYGLFVPSTWGKALDAASRISFPNAVDRVLGGCIGDKPQALVYECDACWTAKNRWLAANRPP